MSWAKVQQIKFVDENKHLLHGLVLDVGCGKWKRNTVQCWKDTDGKIVSPKISRVVSFDIEGYEQKDVVIGSIENAPFKDSEFDSVISTETLEHVLNPGIALKEMGRVIKKAGYLILTCRWIYPYDGWVCVTKGGLLRGLKLAGFNIVEYEPSKWRDEDREKVRHLASDYIGGLDPDREYLGHHIVAQK